MNNSESLITREDVSFVPDFPLTEKQLQFLMHHTPAKHLQKRPAKGGGTWTYVSGGYVRKALNLMFAWDWDFEVLEDNMSAVMSGMCDEAIVKGRLSFRINGKTIVKTQYGNKEVIYKKGTDKPLSLGNDFKSAATDALKKCAADIGIAADVYYPEEFKAHKVVPQKEKEYKNPVKND